MDKQELAQYLTNLMLIMEGKEKAGRKRGTRLATEYEKHYNMLLDAIAEEADEEDSGDAQQP